MNINLSSTTTSQVYLGTSDVIKLAEYDYTSQHSGTMLLYQCKLHYTVLCYQEFITVINS